MRDFVITTFEFLLWLWMLICVFMGLSWGVIFPIEGLDPVVSGMFCGAGGLLVGSFMTGFGILLISINANLIAVRRRLEA